MFSKVTSKSAIDSMVANKINEGTVITGDISAQTDIRLDGRILGNINCSSKVVIGASAQINGNIKCNDLTLEGKVKGNLEVSGVLYFKESAVFEGDVKYKKLVVEEGAAISGSLVNVSALAKPVQQVVQNGTGQTQTVVQTAG